MDMHGGQKIVSSTPGRSEEDEECHRIGEEGRKNRTTHVKSRSWCSSKRKVTCVGEGMSGRGGYDSLKQERNRFPPITRVLYSKPGYEAEDIDSLGIFTLALPKGEEMNYHTTISQHDEFLPLDHSRLY
ncbi:hypothetical protein Tco_0174063 [Tanacetum coccineum]